MDYVVVTGRYEMELEAQVNKLIPKGFRPQGGVSVAVNSRGGYSVYAQALIRHTDSAPEED